MLGASRSETDSNRPNNTYPDFPDRTNTEGRLDMNASVAGWISRNDVDWFRVSLVRDMRYTFDLEGVSTNGGSLSDPVMDILNASGTSTSTSIYSSSGTSDRADFTAGYTGYYYVSAKYAVDDPGSGYLGVDRTYTLSVSGDVPADDSTNAVVTTNRQGVEGKIDLLGDIDWFAVELEGGQSYRIDLEGNDTGHGRLEDPMIAGVYDASSDRVPGTQDDNGGEGKNALVTFKARSSGTYYVAASSIESDNDRYSLTVRPYVPALKVHSSAPDLPANTTTSGVVEVDGVGTKGFVSEPILTESGTGGGPDLPEST